MRIKPQDLDHDLFEKIFDFQTGRNKSNRTVGCLKHDICDHKEIQWLVRRLRDEVVLRESGFFSLNNSNNSVLQSALERALKKSCGRFVTIEDRVPPLSKQMLSTILRHTSTVLSFMESNACVINQQFTDNRPRKVTLSQFADLVAECVFCAIDWKSDEAIPFIRALLFAGCFGNVSVFRTTGIIRFIEKRKINNQPFVNHQSLSKRSDSWLRFTKYLRNYNKRSYLYSDDIRKNAIARIDNRSCEIDVVLSRVINMLKPRTFMDKVVLKSEPCIIDMAIVRSSEIKPYYVIYTINEIISSIQYYSDDIRLVRGLLAFLYPLSEKRDLERVLANSRLVEAINNRSKKRKVGLRKNFKRAYMQTGFFELMSYLPERMKLDYRVCSTIGFFYSLYSNKHLPKDCMLEK